MAEGFGNRQVIRITGVTERQLTYWRRTGLLCPSRCTAGGHARYSFHDLIALKTAKRLIDAGVSVQRIRKVIDSLVQFLPTIERPIGEVSLVATGDVVLVFHQGMAFEALSGQEWVLPVAALQRDIARDCAAGQNPPIQEDLFPALPTAFDVPPATEHKKALP